MANNKYAGYTPKGEETISNEGSPGSGNRLDRVNPYEFRKGMDLELTGMGVSRLAESTPKEREKATETVLKNLNEHGGYYTSLVTYETTYRNIAKGNKKPSFKTWLAEQDNSKMKEVTKDGKDKNNQMEKPKYDKSMYTLKEAIAKEVKAMLAEAKDKEAEKINKADANKEVSDEKEASKGAKGKEKALKALDKEIEALKKEKDKNKEKLSTPLKRYKDGKLTADEYKKLSSDMVKRNKEINTRLSDIEKEKNDITLKEKMGRREVAKTMMEKDTHMEILNIMKEAGVNLREGAGGIKMYYEIAKTAYQEGFMAGLNK